MFSSFSFSFAHSSTNKHTYIHFLTPSVRRLCSGSIVCFTWLFCNTLDNSIFFVNAIAWKSLNTDLTLCFYFFFLSLSSSALNRIPMNTFTECFRLIACKYPALKVIHLNHIHNHKYIYAIIVCVCVFQFYLHLLVTINSNA